MMILNYVPSLDALSFWNLVALCGLALIALLHMRRSDGWLPYVFLLFILIGTTGILLSQDLFCFFVFWELTVIPLFFWVFLFGGQRRVPAALQYFLFTQGSGAVFLVSVIALGWQYNQYAGAWTFDLNTLASFPHQGTAIVWIALGMSLPFLVKLPVVPFHAWMPALFAEAPAPAVIAGIMLKVGAFGFLRVVMPLFPEETSLFAPWMLALGAVTIAYGGLSAFRQTDGKRFLAFATIGHMGLILMAIFSQQTWSDDATVILILTQAFAGTGLLLVIDHWQRQAQHPSHLQGLFGKTPRASFFAIVLIMAFIGLPGFGPFIGEFLAFLGIYQEFGFGTVFALAGTIFAAVYGVRFLQQWVFGKSSDGNFIDLNSRQLVSQTTIVLVLLIIGLWPAPILRTLQTGWAKPSAPGHILDSRTNKPIEKVTGR